MIGCSTRRSLCQAAPRNLVRHDNPPTPHGLTFRHTLGSGVFELFGTVGKNTSTLAVTCRVPGLALNSVLGGAAPRRRSNRAALKTKTLPFCTGTPSVPVRFRCVVHPWGHGGQTHLDVCCRCGLGQLVVEGVSFLEEVSSSCDGPESVFSDRAYQGPNVTQQQLADVLSGRIDPSSPLIESRQAAAAPFDSTLNEEASRFAKYGHTPVHTVNGELGSALVDALASFGIDDELAEFVEVCAHRIQEREEKMWNRLSKQYFVTPL